jgi:hypothetical protein
MQGPGLYERACTRARGDESLSGRQQGESDGIEKSKGSRAKGAKDGPRDKGRSRDKGVRKHRAADLGRALRSVYDDTLRESVPVDFLDLLGKLS